ncbi:MAG: hypothetical protein EXR72_10855 [Myxococcales bacterium]|nr:hypothetical protein [Myxococcales bacterium]
MTTRFLLPTLFLVAASSGCGTSAGPSDQGAPDRATSDLAVADLAGAPSPDQSAPGDLASPPDSAAAQNCKVTPVSNLPNVSLAFKTPVCVFTVAQAAAGIQLPYEVVVSEDVGGVIAVADNRCAQPGPSGLILLERVSGMGQNYCVCDSGKCAPPKETPVILKKGSYAGIFQWDGRNWNGPSDTMNPKGAAFPPGSYDVAVSAKGRVTVGMMEQPFAVSATLAIVLK